jgi:hypothetical protein
MKNIHVLPTDKPSRLVSFEGTTSIQGITKSKTVYKLLGGIHSLEQIRQIGYTPNNIYITSDVEIKEGDWFIHKTNADCSLHKCIDRPAKQNVIGDNNIDYFLGFCKKIILTTDRDLIKDGVQAIDDEFLKWFVKNSSYEEVGIDLIPVNEFGSHVTVGGYGFDKFIYKIIIPKEEPKQEWNPTQGEEVWIKVFSNWSKGTYIGYDVVKQTHIVREEEKGGGNLFSSTEVLPYTEAAKKEERIFNVSMMKQETTLEEAALKLYPKLISDPYNPDEDLMAEERNIFIAGAKWQAEKSYTKEEVIAFVKWTYDYKADINRVEEWLEQFKK